jgi:hypothetical protein
MRASMRRPSPAMVVAVIALSAAMSASAVARPGGTSEAYREVGSAGNPAFQNGCTNLGGVYQTAAFFKDAQGIVYLKGAVTCPGTSQVAFELPPGYRPAADKDHIQLSIVASAPDGDGEVAVDGAGGAVLAPNATGAFFLDGIEFRAAS